MRSKNNAPTAAQKRWREAVRELGSVISGGPAVIHHCVGVSAKHNKIPIGHEWIIPLTDEEHKALHSGNLDWLLCETKYEGMTRKEFEKAAYLKVGGIIFNGWKLIDGIVKEDLPSFEVHQAIMSYHK